MIYSLDNLKRVNISLYLIYKCQVQRNRLQSLKSCIIDLISGKFSLSLDNLQTNILMEDSRL